MNLVEGARYSEAADGTNGIGTALAADHAFQVFAFEHFNERHHEWVCSGAPVHDPVSGQTVGLIDLSSLWKIAHPRSLELVTTAARTMEQRLVEVRRDRDARLRRRYSDLVTRSTDLLVNRDGYVLDGRRAGSLEATRHPGGRWRGRAERRVGRRRGVTGSGRGLPPPPSRHPPTPRPHRSRCSSAPKSTFASSSPNRPRCVRSRPSSRGSPLPTSSLPPSPSRSPASSTSPTSGWSATSRTARS